MSQRPFSKNSIARISAFVNPRILGDTVDICGNMWDTVFGASDGALGAAQRQAVYHTTLKGVMVMPITLTFHVLYWTVTIRVKSRNRHSAK